MQDSRTTKFVIKWNARTPRCCASRSLPQFDRRSYSRRTRNNHPRCPVTRCPAIIDRVSGSHRQLSMQRFHTYDAPRYQNIRTLQPRRVGTEIFCGQCGDSSQVSRIDTPEIRDFGRAKWRQPTGGLVVALMWVSFVIRKWIPADVISEGEVNRNKSDQRRAPPASVAIVLAAGTPGPIVVVVDPAAVVIGSPAPGLITNPGPTVRRTPSPV